MSKLQKLLQKILLGNSDSNIGFSELRNLLVSIGFNERIKGSHHIFTRDTIREIINIQPNSENKAKAYHVRQIRELILTYNLGERNDSD